jgi:hypothetical protein
MDRQGTHGAKIALKREKGAKVSYSERPSLQIEGSPRLQVALPLYDSVLSLILKSSLFQVDFHPLSSMVILDFVLNPSWSLIATSKLLDFQAAHDAFVTTYNGTDIPARWSCSLSRLTAVGIPIGSGASDHAAKKRKNASITATKGNI